MNILFLSIGRLNDIDERDIYRFIEDSLGIIIIMFMSLAKKRLNLPTEFVNEKE